MISSFVRRLFDNLLVPDVPVFSKLMYLDKDYLVVACTLSHLWTQLYSWWLLLQHFLDLSTSQDSTRSPVCAAKLPCIGLSYLTKSIFSRFKVLGALVSFQFPFVFRNFLASITALTVSKTSFIILQRSLYNVWVKTSELRTSVAKQRIKLQQARQAHRLRSILSTHVSL